MVYTEVANQRMSPVAADWALQKSRLPGWGSTSIMPTITPWPDATLAAYDRARVLEQQRLDRIRASEQRMAQMSLPTRDFTGQGTTQTPVGGIAGTGMLAPSQSAIGAGQSVIPGTAATGTMPAVTPMSNETGSMSVPTSDFLQKALSGVERQRGWQAPMQRLEDESGSDQWINSLYASVQQQTYGTPLQDTFNGMTLFDSQQQMYYGITTDMQAMGYIYRDPTPAKVPGPDATYEERLEYQKKLQQQLRPPQYRIGSAQTLLANMTRADRLDLQKKLAAGRLLPEDYVVFPGELRYQEIEAFVKVLGSANLEGREWEETLQMRLAEVRELRKREKARRSGGGGGGGATNRQVNIQYTQTSLAQGRSLLANVLRDALGRPPSQSELAEFMSRLNAAENKSPVRTVTNYVRDGSTTTATSRTRPSTVDPDQLAREFAAEIGGGDEMAGYQANRFMDLLMARLMGAQNV